MWHLLCYHFCPLLHCLLMASLCFSIANIITSFSVFHLTVFFICFSPFLALEFVVVSFLFLLKVSQVRLTSLACFSVIVECWLSSWVLKQNSLTNIDCGPKYTSIKQLECWGTTVIAWLLSDFNCTNQESRDTEKVCIHTCIQIGLKTKTCLKGVWFTSWWRKLNS